MRLAASWRAVALLLVGMALAAGCAPEAGGPRPRVRRDPNLLLVYAACGLAPRVQAAAEKFQQEREGKLVDIEADEPLALVERVQKGEVPDLLICLGDAEIGLLEREGFLDRASFRSMGSYRLVIATPAGAPVSVTKLDDLTSPRVKKITMAMPGISSLGSHGKAALTRLELWDRIQPKLLLTKTPLEALKILAAGKVDAGIIYDPCPLLQSSDWVPADSLVVAVPLEPESNRQVRIHAALHKRSPNPALARQFMAVLMSADLGPGEAAAPPAEEEAETPQQAAGAEGE